MIMFLLGQCYLKSVCPCCSLRKQTSPKDLSEGSVLSPQSLPADHPDIVSVHSHLGIVRGDRRECNLALKNYKIAYEIRRTQLPPNHPHIANFLDNFGAIYKVKDDHDQTLEYYQHVLKIDEINYPNDSLHKANIIEILVARTVTREILILLLSIFITLFTRTDGPHQVSQFYKDVLSILENFKLFDYETTSKYLMAITCCFGNSSVLVDGLKWQLRALELHRHNISSDHLYIALCYEDMNNLSGASRCFNERHSNYQANCSSNSRKMVNRHSKIEIISLKINRKTLVILLRKPILLTKTFLS
ncbi:unnamed protein product [Adineta ricciae]|uniref:Uncharacterized protein n=1 Tax=Adineta ricciae TaxID=249248 RepID=A0A815H667_ADIRI|nr:unnamed protein product [Adineta ricciae]CAF1349818.1 unnamed protein product [Adineta ricciae]